MRHGGERFALRPEQATLPPESGWNRVPAIAVWLGVLGIAASAVLGASDPKQFFFSWLVAFLFFLSLALGSLYFVLIHWAMQGGWGVVVRRLAENTMATLPLFVVLFVPLLFGIERLFPWSVPGAVEHDSLLYAKQAYLNTPFFVARAAFYLACWSLLAWIWSRGSRSQDESGDPRISARLRRFSGPALALLGVTQTFASIDWIMSLEPHWYSTMFGVYYFSGALVSAFALLVLLAVLLERNGVLRGVLSTEHLHDLGKLLFAFTAFWAYIAFSQFFLIWYGNLPEETIWYKVRLEGSWKPASAALALGHFALPFFYLMARTVKRKRAPIVVGAAWLLVMHLLDIHWLVMPVLHEHGMHVTALDATTFLAVGGCFTAALGWRMRRGALVPLRDPRLHESLSFESV